MRVETLVDDGRKKEDSLLASKDVFGVFDGAGPLDPFPSQNGKSAGLIASSIAKEEFAKDGPLVERATLANTKIREAMLAAGADVSRKTSLWCTTAAAIRLRKDAFDWLQIGDSLILVINEDGSFKLLVEDYDHDQEVLSIWKQLAQQKKEGIRKLIDSPLRELRSTVNKGYGCLTGEKEALDFIKEGTHTLEGVKHILLFTDGLFLPKEDPTEGDDWDRFVRIFLKEGLLGLKTLVRSLEAEDPNCWKYPRYKQYDDISAIALTFQPHRKPV